MMRNNNNCHTEECMLGGSMFEHYGSNRLAEDYWLNTEFDKQRKGLL